MFLPSSARNRMESTFFSNLLFICVIPIQFDTFCMNISLSIVIILRLKITLYIFQIKTYIQTQIRFKFLMYRYIYVYVNMTNPIKGRSSKYINFLQCYSYVIAMFFVQMYKLFHPSEL